MTGTTSDTKSYTIDAHIISTMVSYLIMDDRTYALPALAAQGYDMSPHLWDAALHGSVTAAKLALEAGADPSMCEIFGLSALGRAAARGHCEIVRMMIDHGADVHYVDRDGLRAIDYARSGLEEQHPDNQSRHRQCIDMLDAAK